MLATVPKEQHREVLRQTNEELLRKTAMLAIQYERTIADMAQNQRSRMTPLNNGLVCACVPISVCNTYFRFSIPGFVANIM